MQLLDSVITTASLGLALLGWFCVKSFFYYSHWRKKGVATPFWPIPVLGNAYPVVLMWKCFGVLYHDMYFSTEKNLPYFGIYSVRGPTLVLKDFTLIKDILTKDSVHFVDHNKPLDDMTQRKAPLRLHLFNLTGEKWKRMRVRLTPTFTTSKMKYMFSTVAACNLQMLSSLGRAVQENEGKGHSVDMKELFSALNTDVIGSCAFGIDCNSFTDPHSAFTRMSKLVLATPTGFVLTGYLTLLFPKLFRGYVADVDKKLEKFFHGLVRETIRHREENSVERSDFLQLLINLQKESGETSPGEYCIFCSLHSRGKK